MVVQAYILIQTDVGKAAEVAAEIADVKGVTMAEDVTGPYDVIVRAEARNVDELGKLVVARVQNIPGITRTLTCPGRAHLRHVTVPCLDGARFSRTRAPSSCLLHSCRVRLHRRPGRGGRARTQVADEAAACADLVAALPDHVADQIAPRGRSPTWVGRRVGRPADRAALRRSAAAPASTSCRPARSANGVGWFIPEDQITGGAVDIAMTTIGRSPGRRGADPGRLLPAGGRPWSTSPARSGSTPSRSPRLRPTPSAGRCRAAAPAGSRRSTRAG